MVTRQRRKASSLPVVKFCRRSSKADWIQATGVVREIAAQTQLAVADCGQLQILASGLPLPDAQALDPPAEAEASRSYYEALEGMLVSVDEPALVIGPKLPLRRDVCLAGEVGHRSACTGATRPAR